MQNKHFHIFLLATLFLIFVWSFINPHDLFTWFLEIFPAVIGISIVIVIYPKFKFTNLVYFLIWIHAIILIVGGHYTYAEMPLFNWLRDTFDLSRNYYDRLGHFAQGFIPAMVIREVFIRKSVVKSSKWLFFIVVSICLAISAAYELLEFTVAMLTGTAAESFLGTQGDIWDTQWDMLYALVGSITSLLFLKKAHNKALDHEN